MSRQYWSETVSWATADGTAVANTATETIIFPNITIPANFLQDGRVLRVRAFGKYSSTSTPTLTFWLRWGGVAGTVLCTSAAVTVGSSVTNAAWDTEIFVQTRSNGVAGSLMAEGLVNIGSATASSVGSATGAAAFSHLTAGGQTAPAVATVDLTADTALALTAKWSAQSASNTLMGLIYTVEALN